MADGEISRNGAFFRWNLYPSYIAFRPPYLLVFDETEGKAEVRHVAMGKMSEVIECKGMRPIRLSRADQALLALTPEGIIEVVEVCHENLGVKMRADGRLSHCRASVGMSLWLYWCRQ